MKYIIPLLACFIILVSWFGSALIGPVFTVTFGIVSSVILGVLIWLDHPEKETKAEDPYRFSLPEYANSIISQMVGVKEIDCLAETITKILETKTYARLVCYDPDDDNPFKSDEDGIILLRVQRIAKGKKGDWWVEDHMSRAWNLKDFIQDHFFPISDYHKRFRVFPGT